LPATRGFQAYSAWRWQEDATVALVVGIVSNTLLKLVITLALGRGMFRIVTGVVLAAMAGATAAALAAG
jgi:hypothetical protein